MKIAILGYSPLALEAALRFHTHGAALTWFLDQKVDYSLFSHQTFAANEFTSELGLNLLSQLEKSYHSLSFDWGHWHHHYFLPLITFLKSSQVIREDEILSVGKRFLAMEEEISGKSRFYDLFRVIYHIDPKEFIDDQKLTNQETYQKLTEEFVNSLARTIEMYEDFDLVIDLRHDLSKASASVSGKILGESREIAKVTQAMESLALTREDASIKDDHEIVLVGSDELAASILLNMENWLDHPAHRLFVVSREEDPFSKVLTQDNSPLAEKLKLLLAKFEQQFFEETQKFSHELRIWQEKDDFIRAKIPAPSEPIPRLVFFSGHNVTAIDELIDQSRLFITLEKPDFREGKKHPDNNHLELKTLGVDRILISHAKRNNSIVFLTQNELGYFNLIPRRPGEVKGFERDLLKLQEIENEIFKLFSPLDPH